MSNDCRPKPVNNAAQRADASAPHPCMPRKRLAPTLSRANTSDAARSNENPRDRIAFPDRPRDFALHLSLSQEHERLRIAIGLHDQVGQSLALLNGKLDELQTTGGMPQHARLITEMCALVTETIEATRMLTFDLASPVLHQLGLEPALRSLGERLQRQHRVRFRLEARKPRKQNSEATNVIIYRCARELLRNVADHAQAQHVTMRITELRDKLAVAVEDDGVGFDSSGLESSFSPRGRFGLYSIAEQLRLMGGRLKLHSAPGKGTRALMIVPFELANGRDNNPAWQGDATDAPAFAPAHGGRS